MNCNLSRDSMMKYFDGECNDIESARLKQHIKSCKECGQEFKELSRLFCLLEADLHKQPPNGFEEEVMARVNRLEEQKRKKRTGLLIFAYNFSLLVSIVLLLTFVARLEGIMVLGLPLNKFLDMDFMSLMLVSLFHGLKQFIGVFINLGDLFYQSALIIIEEYYYYIIAASSLIILARRMLDSQVKQNRRGA